MKEEFDALNAVFEERGPRTDDYIQAMRALWTQDKPTYSGAFVRFENAYCRPQPCQATVPIIVGGHSMAAARRAGRLGDGFFPARGIPEDLIALARTSAEEAGRDPAEVEITLSVPDDLARLPELAAMGVSRVLVPVANIQGMNTVITGPDDALAWRDRLARYAEL